VREEFQFLSLRGERIFTAQHLPAAPPTRAVVMCHPLGEEKLWAHRVFVSFARDLAKAGFAVLRFDCRGEGDSDREFQDADLDSRIEDTHLVIDTVRQWHPTVTDISLLGLRFGAAVAAVTAARHSNVSRLALWDPVTDGATYMQSVLRLNLMFQMAQHRKVIENREALVERLTRGETVNIEGYELAQPLFEQASRFRLKDALAQFTGDILIAQVDQGENPAKPEFSALAEQNQKCRIVAVKEEPFWKEIRTFYQRAPELTRVTFQALGIDS
jgi:exosortase A-associated hydrolase 2